MLISYAFVHIFESEPGEYSMHYVSVITYAIVAGMLLGLQEIAVSMSNPFGDDATDFDTRTLCHDAYNNAVSYLEMSVRVEQRMGRLNSPGYGCEAGITNPMLAVAAANASLYPSPVPLSQASPSKLPSPAVLPLPTPAAPKPVAPKPVAPKPVGATDRGPQGVSQPSQRVPRSARPAASKSGYSVLRGDETA